MGGGVSVVGKSTQICYFMVNGNELFTNMFKGELYSAVHKIHKVKDK